MYSGANLRWPITNTGLMLVSVPFRAAMSKHSSRPETMEQLASAAVWWWMLAAALLELAPSKARPAVLALRLPHRDQGSQQAVDALPGTSSAPPQSPDDASRSRRDPLAVPSAVRPQRSRPASAASTAARASLLVSCRTPKPS